MKSTDFKLIKYESDEGKVFDWAEPRFIEEFDENGNVIKKTQEHLYAKVLFIGSNDDINNYIEVNEWEADEWL